MILTHIEQNRKILSPIVTDQIKSRHVHSIKQTIVKVVETQSGST